MALSSLYDDLPSSLTDYSSKPPLKKRKIDEKKINTLQKFRYLVILDFEATCDAYNKPILSPQEIIEWPAMIIDTQTNELLTGKHQIFHHYIKPKHNPKLTQFCQSLTGITQKLIDLKGSKNSIESVTEKWNLWCFENNLLPFAKDKANAMIVTCGDWDLKTMWKQQCKISKCSNAVLFHSWINIKNVFGKHTLNKHRKVTMMSMLRYFKIKHEGRHHSGYDDVKNIAKIAQKLLNDGAKFDGYTTTNSGKTNVCTDLLFNLRRQIKLKEEEQKLQKEQAVDLTKDEK